MKPLLYAFALLSTVGLHADELASPPPERGFLQTLTMLVLAGLLFYFIMFRPEQKRRKALEEVRSTLKKGDRVTAVGIIGTVAKVQEETVIVRMYDGSKIEFLKAAISEVTPGNESDAKED